MIEIKTGREIAEDAMKMISDKIEGKPMEEHKRIYREQWISLSSLKEQQEKLIKQCSSSLMIETVKWVFDSLEKKQ